MIEMIVWKAEVLFVGTKRYLHWFSVASETELEAMVMIGMVASMYDSTSSSTIIKIGDTTQKVWV